MQTRLLTFYLLVFFIQGFGQTPLNDWQRKLKLAKHDTTRMRCYSELANIQGRGDSIFFYAKKGLEISRKYPNHIINATLLNAIGRSYEFKSNLDSALYYYNLAHQVSLRLNDDKQIKYTDFNRILLSKSPAEQISELLRMLKKYHYVTSRNYDKSLLFGIYSMIADKYIDLNNLNKGTAYLTKSQKYIYTYRDSVYYNVKYSSLLVNEAEQQYKTQQVVHLAAMSEKYRIFLAQIEKSTLTRKDNLAQQLMAVVYGNYAVILTYEKRYKESIHYINKASSQIKELPESLLYMKYESLGKNYVGLGEFEKGITYLKKAYAFYKNSPFNNITFTILKLMSVASSKLGDYKQSYQYLEQAVSINETYYSSKQQQLSLEVDKQFELAEKQEQIAAQELEGKLKEERIKIETQQKYVFIGILILSLGLLAWALWSYVKQRELRQLLEIKNQQLEEQTHILELQAKELLDANETKDKIFAVLGHDLQSPISDLKAITMLFQSNDITPSEVQELIAPLTVKIESLQTMMNNLLQWSLHELKHQNSNCQVIQLTTLIEKVIQQLQPNADKKGIEIAVQQQHVEIMANTEEIEIVLRNLLSNAIKFTPINGHISIDTVEEYHTVEVKIKDSGVGVPTAIQHNTSTYPISKMGTAKEKGIGLGLRIVRDLTAKNGVLFSINGDGTNGTTVSLIFQN